VNGVLKKQSQSPAAGRTHPRLSFGKLSIRAYPSASSGRRLRSSAVSHLWPLALLPAEGLEHGLFGLSERGAVGVVPVELSVNGPGLLDIFHAARGDHLTGKNFGNVIVIQL
jgi:hypothetical protein